MFSISLVTVLALGGSITAYAGLKNPGPVSAGPGWGFGALGTARNSANGMERIHCRVTAAKGVATEVSCAAVDAEGNGFGCKSTNPEIVKVALAINGDSWVYFSTSNQDGDPRTPFSEGECTGLTVEHNSEFEPKVP